MSKLIYFRMLGYVVTILMHSINTVSMTLVLHSSETVELFKDPMIKNFNENQARYFTCWTFFMQVVYAGIGLTCDYLTLKNAHNKDYQLNKHLRRSRETIFSAIVWPSTFLVSSIFWGLFHLDRELIFPLVLDKALSRTSNHIIHTATVPVVLWEVLFRPRPKPRSHSKNIAYILFNILLYLSVVFYTYYTKGSWIYPLFKKTWGTVLFPLFLMLVVILLIIYYYAQWPLTRLVHGSVQNKSKSQ